MGELLPIALDPMQHPRDAPADQVDVDSAIRGAQRAGVVQGHRGHVHEGVGPLQQQEGVVEGAEAVVGVAGQRSSECARAG